MDKDPIRLRQPWWMGKLWRVGVTISLAAVIAVLLATLHLQDAPTTPSSIQVITYLEGSRESPVDKGDPVCLTGVVEAIGRVKRVHTLGRRWEVVMSLDKRWQPKIPADSVTLLRMSWDDRGRCGFSDAQGRTQFSKRMRFLEIDTSAYGRCFDRPNCKVSETPITGQSVLQASYRLFCGEEGSFCGSVVEFFPQPWWRRVVDRPIAFAVMGVGVTYIQLFGAIMIVIVGITTLVVALRRTRARAKRTALPY